MVERVPVKDEVEGPTPSRGAMKKMASFLLEQYKKMPGEKKVKLALEWSGLVREVNREGKIQTNGRNKPTRAS